MTVIHFYFAYGSNMNPERVAERGLVTRDKMGATLSGYKMLFNKCSTGIPGVGHANIEYDKQGVVEGVLYELVSSEEILKMDPFERAPVNYGRDRVCLETAGGPRWAWTYFANAALLQDDLLPERAYLDHLLKGKPYLSDSYFNFLERCEVI